MDQSPGLLFYLEWNAILVYVSPRFFAGFGVGGIT